MAMQLIDSVTLTGNAATVSIASIPSTFKDLMILVSARTDRNTGTGSDVMLQFNNDSTSGNYQWTGIWGNGSSVTSLTDPTNYGDDAILTGFTSQANNTSNTFGNFAIYVSNYASTAVFKCVSSDGVSENNATGAVSTITAGLWRSTSAITSITFDTVTASNYVSGSTFYVYGIS